MVFFNFIFFCFFLELLFIVIPNIHLKGKIISNSYFFIAFLLYQAFFYWVTETTDWKNYEYIFSHDERPVDYAFRFLCTLIKSYGYDYIHVYRLHVILTGFLLVNFISKFTIYRGFVTLMIVLLLYVQLANQIRFFLSLMLLLNSLYYLFNKRFLIGIILAFLSILSHIGIIPLFLILIFALSFKSTNSLFNIVLWSMIPIFILIKLLISTLKIYFDSGFMIYLENEYGTSFTGAMFQLIPFIFSYLMLYINRKKILAFCRIDTNNKFLIKIILGSLFFLPLVFTTQIIFWRYIYALIFIWILVLLRVKVENKTKNRIVGLTTIFFIQLMFHVYYWYLPVLLLNSKDSIEKIELILNSVTIQ